MGKKTPSMSSRQAEEYLKIHLFNELRWLLCAATEWSIQAQLNLRLVGYDIQVYAMDSAFLHARSLFEFFVGATTDNHYGCEEFLGKGAKLISRNYEEWNEPLHSFLMHSRDRSNPASLHSYGSGVVKDLKEMPVDFGLEILRLWKDFEGTLASSSVQHLQPLSKPAREKRQEAINAAECAVSSVVARLHAEVKEQRLRPVFVFD